MSLVVSDHLPSFTVKFCSRPNEKLGLGDSAGHGLPSNTAGATHRPCGADEHPGASRDPTGRIGWGMGPKWQLATGNGHVFFRPELEGQTRPDLDDLG